MRAQIIEEFAQAIEQARIAGQKYHWLGAFWIYFNDPFPKRDELASLMRMLLSHPQGNGTKT